MSDRGSRLPTVTSNIPRDLRIYLDRVRESLSSLSGEVGSITTVYQSATGGGGTTTDPGDVDTPTAPTGFELTEGYDFLYLEWDYPTVEMYSGHAYTEVYRAADADFGSKAFLGIAAGSVYVDAVGPAATFCYWIRHVNVNGVAGPWNSTTGLCGTSDIDVPYIVDELYAQLDESVLTAELNTRLDLLDDSADPLSIYSRLTDTEGDVTANATAITALESGLTAAEDGITTNASAITTLDTRTTAVEGGVTTNATDITLLQSGLTTAEGSISTNAAAVSALDTRTTAVEGGVSTNATSITSLESAMTAAESGISANAGAISALDAEVTALDGVVTATTSDVTQLQATVGGGGGNLIGDATLLNNWSFYESRVEYKVEYLESGDANALISANGERTCHIVYEGWTASGFAEVKQLDVVVEPSEYYQASAYINTSGQLASVIIQWLNAAGSVLSEVGSAGVQYNNASRTSLNGYQRINIFAQAPSTAVRARVGVRSTYTGASVNYGHIWFVRPFFAKADADQVTPSPWAASGSPELFAALEQRGMVYADSSGAAGALYTLKMRASDADGDAQVGFGMGVIKESGKWMTDVRFSAERFAIMSPASYTESGTLAAGNYPFIVYTSPTTVNGETVPAGVYMKDAYIANGTITTAKIGDAAITNAKIVDLNASKIKAGNIGVSEYIRSASYVSNSAGWSIGGNGAAEFNDITIREDGRFYGTIYGGAAAGYASGTGLFAGDVSGTYKFRVGHVNGARLDWNGDTLFLFDNNNNVVMSSGSDPFGVTRNNLLDNTLFSDDFTDWGTYDPSNKYNNYALDGDSGSSSALVQPGGRKTVILWGNVGSTGYNGTYMLLTQSVAATPGVRYEASAYVRAVRCDAGITVDFKNGSGTIIGTETIVTPEGTAFSGETIDKYVRVGGFGVAPAGTATAVFSLRIAGTTSSSPSAGFVYPYFGIAGSVQSVLSQWAPKQNLAFMDQIKASNASTYIADAAIGNAQIGNAAITTAKINDAAVDTLKIAGNAVIVPAAVFQDFSITLSPSTWTTVSAVGLTTDVSSRMLVNFAGVVTAGVLSYAYRAPFFDVRLVHNGSVVFTFSRKLWANASPETDDYSFTYVSGSNDSAGYHDWYVQVKPASGIGVPFCTTRSISVFGVQR